MSSRIEGMERRHSQRDNSVPTFQDSKSGRSRRSSRKDYSPRGRSPSTSRSRSRSRSSSRDRHSRRHRRRSSNRRHRRYNRDRDAGYDSEVQPRDTRKKRSRRSHSLDVSPKSKSRRRGTSRSYHSDDSIRSSHRRHRRTHRRSSYSPDDSSRERSSKRRGRRRNRKSSRKRRRRDSYSDHDDRSTSVPRSPRYPLPPVEVPPRAGVVSDEDDHGHQQQHSTKVPPPVVGRDPTEFPKTLSDKKSPEPCKGSHKRKGSASSSHDDTVGHFQGGEGTVIDGRYRVEREVGLGTFGKVLECLDLKRSRDRSRSGRSSDRYERVVAIKVVRNVKRYHESAVIEADILEDVNRRGGRGVSHCVIMYDAFSFKGHYCMVFEKLGPSLYDFLKRHKYRPFPSVCVRDFAKQLLETLEFLHSFRLIHTDLKPENILLLNSREVNYQGRIIPECTRIKVIDFGGATYDSDKKSSLVNTRQYRAPEVMLGVGWSMPSDLWSAGCILAELYQGELLFATHDNLEHLALMERIIGLFPRGMLRRAKNEQLVQQAFNSSHLHRMEQVLAPQNLAYVKRSRPLESIIAEADGWFLRLLRRILVIDPEDRASAREVLKMF